MANNIKKEVFTKGFDSNNSPLLLENGTIADGKNIRPIGNRGGWKGRTGSTLRNTTAAGSAVVEGIPYYNDLTDYFRLLYHYGDYFYTGTSSLTQAAGLGTSLGFDVGTSVGHFCQIGESIYYANGETLPVVYSGGPIKCRSFVSNYILGGIYGTSEVNDGDSDTYILVLLDATDTTHNYLVCSSERASGIKITLGATVCTSSSSARVTAWRSNTWTAVSDLVDGTYSSGTHAIDGTLSWTASNLDEMRVINGVMGYWYRVRLESGGVSDPFHIAGCSVISPMSYLTNKWDGIFEYSSGVYFYDASVAPYFVDILGEVSDESQSTYFDISSAVTNDYLYIKHSSPLAGVGFAIVDGYENSASAVIDSVKVFAAEGWTTITGVVDGTSDGTSSFSQTGYIFWNFDSVSPRKITLSDSVREAGDPLPGYWYEFSWDAALSADVRIYLIVIAEAPGAFATASGCAEFDSRLVSWGGPKYPNRLRYSPKSQPDQMRESSSYTPAFGSGGKVLVAKTFYEYLFVGKRDSIFLLAKDLTIKRVTSNVGVVSADTVEIAEVGTSNMQKELIINVAIWLDVDGVYQYDLEGVAKISLLIDNYFNSNHSDYLGITNIAAAKSFIDQERNEYHLLIEDTELVYNYAYQVWYPPWDREIPLLNGVSFRADDNAFYSFGFSTSGFALQLENGTSERNTANAEVAVLPELRTRAISPNESGIGVAFTLRSIWIVAKADNVNAPNFSINVYKNLGTVALSGYSSQFAKDNHSLVIIQLDFSELDCTVFEVKINSTGTDAEMEIYEILYEYEERSRILNDD